MSDDSLTVLKYKLSGNYEFHVMDKYDEEDEVRRLDKMIEYSAEMEITYGDQYKQLWIKWAPIFPVKG